MIAARVVRVLAPACAIAAVSSLCLAICAEAASAQGFKSKLLVDESTPRPDGGTFAVVNDVVIDGAQIAFMTEARTPGGLRDAIWAVNVDGSGITKLAGLTTHVPHGAGSFTDFGDGPITAGGGFVVFFGRDANGTTGLYTVPIDGGRIRRVVTNGVTAPDGGTFDQLSNPSTNGKRVVFHGHTTAGHSGIYAASLSGANLSTVIDEGTSFPQRGDCGEAGTPIVNFDGPVIGRVDVAFHGTGNGDPSIFPSGIYTAATPLADNKTPLQGNKDTCPHNTFGQISADLQTRDIAFQATDGNSGFRGIFLVRNVGRKAFSFANTRMKGPHATGPFVSFGGIALDDEGLVFSAGTARVGSGIFFTPGVGQPIVLVVADGSVADRALSGGLIAYSTGNNSFGRSVWVAIPKASTAVR